MTLALSSPFDIIDIRDRAEGYGAGLIMYLRFVLPRYVNAYLGEAGFFSSAYEVCRRSSTPSWIGDQLRRELTWFDSHLDVPDRLELYFRRRRERHGLCWFRPEAVEFISRARYCGWLMEEAGEPVRELRLSRPGQVIWKDDAQIVAIPERALPRAFH